MSQVYEIRKSCFTETCCNIMDFFLSHPDIYFTPTTTSLSMEKSLPTIKDCMRLLKQNDYLTKFSDEGTVYHITKENMVLWHTNFKAHILQEYESEEKLQDG